MSKVIRLGHRLRYPITIVRLLKSPGDKIKKQEPILEYSFKWMREIGDSFGDGTHKEEQTTTVTWESPTDGELTAWHLTEGQRVTADRACMAVKEECSHEVQFQGLCGICGKDMTEVNWAAEMRDTARAPISMVHDQTSLTVSAVQAQRTEQELQRRLLQSRKLSLVVDLDQTIIHACIDPTVGEWQKDPTNPNHESVKEIKSFQLEDGPSDLARRVSYYIKTRPGLEAFLKRIAEMYEMHVYTMGTRAYAQNVARVVDPQKKLFGNRVISRDENGNMFAKSLGRLFPVSTHMVVIIDDRSDVWPRNRPNLIKVSAYEFFKGIGDINSSFLPKRQDLLTSEPTAAATNGVNNGHHRGRKKQPAAPKPDKDDAAMRAIVNMTGGEDQALTKRQVEEQSRAFEKQLKDRPLQLLQEKLDREDEEAEKATVQSEDGSESRSSSPAPQRHRVLQDDDTELHYLERHLTRLHRAYYAEYDRNCASHHNTTTTTTSTVATSTAVNLTSVPDVGRILEDLKSTVLRGCTIVLSGILPRDFDIYHSEIGVQIMSFGGELRERVEKGVTHLVVNTAQPGREKLLEARRRPGVKVVGMEWLGECFRRWERVDEEEEGAGWTFRGRVVGEDGREVKEGEGMVVDEEGEGEGDGDKSPNGNGTATGKGNKFRGPRLELTSVGGTTRGVPPPPGDTQNDYEEDEEFEEGLLPDALPDGATSPIDSLKTFNWGSADAELAEFLASGSSDEDEDEEDGNEEDDEKDEDYVQAEKADDDEASSSSEDDKAARRSRSRSGSRSRAASKVAESLSLTATSSRKRKSRDEDGGEEEGGTNGDVNANPHANVGEAGDEAADEEGNPAKKLRRTQSQRSASLRDQFVGGEHNGQQETQPEQGAEGEDNGEEDDMDFDEAALEAEFEAEFERAFEDAEAETAAGVANG